MHNEGRSKSFKASAPIGMHLRVILGAAGLSVAGAADNDIGVTSTPSFAADEPQGVVMRSAQGTQLVTVDGPVAAGAELGASAGGKVGPGTGWGIALQDAAEADDVIEAVRF